MVIKKQYNFVLKITAKNIKEAVAFAKKNIDSRDCVKKIPCIYYCENCGEWVNQIDEVCSNCGGSYLDITLYG